MLPLWPRCGLLTGFLSLLCGCQQQPERIVIDPLHPGEGLKKACQVMVQQLTLTEFARRVGEVSDQGEGDVSIKPASAAFSSVTVWKHDSNAWDQYLDIQFATGHELPVAELESTLGPVMGRAIIFDSFDSFDAIFGEQASSKKAKCDVIAEVTPLTWPVTANTRVRSMTLRAEEVGP